MSKDMDRALVLLEDMQHKFDAVIEIITPIPQMQRDIQQLQEDMSIVKEDLRVMKTVLTSQSHTLNNHETKIIRLETRTTTA